MWIRYIEVSQREMGLTFLSLVGSIFGDMICQACHRTTSGVLCVRCRGQIRPASDLILDGGIRLIAAYEHSGPARTLVHHPKYRGVLDFASMAAEKLAERIPPVPLVLVLRAWSRRFRYGVALHRCLPSAFRP
jgi:predicted amidophosphoribosyltransferase